jgi:hypothetical protein
MVGARPATAPGMHLMTDLWKLDGVETAALIRARKVSAREVITATLARLDAVNPAINGVVLALHEEALAAADEADRALARGDAIGPRPKSTSIRRGARPTAASPPSKTLWRSATIP